MIATAYDHYDSRAADPQLHTHVVVANRVQATHDGKWRTLDSRAVHAAVTGLSEHYNAVLSDHLARILNIGWESRERSAGRSTVWEIIGVPQELMGEFSSRTRDIEQVKDRLVTDYVEKHGRQPVVLAPVLMALVQMGLFVGGNSSRPTERSGGSKRTLPPQLHPHGCSSDGSSP